MEPSLDRALELARRCDVFAAGHPVLTIDDAAALADLRFRLRVRGNGGFVCMCRGDATLRFTDDAGHVLATVAVHHAESLSWDAWDSHRSLIDGPALVEWLAARGCASPLDHLRDSQARAQESVALTLAWSQAVPEGVRHLLPRMLATSQSGQLPSELLLDELRAAMAQMWPDQSDLCRVLLAWFGAGTGRSSGYPVHEGIPGTLLGEVPIGSVIQALQHDDGDIWRGAVRHLAGWRTRSATELQSIPLPLRDRLLAIADDRDPSEARRLRSVWRRR